MVSKSFAVIVLFLINLGIYLFASAPPPLTDETPVGKTIPIQRLFDVVESENDVVRALWTKEIVGKGKKAGFEFDEDWREKNVEAGPLPALFLRETAMSLEKNPVRLGLYLGSDFPIKQANRFEGIQLERFHKIKETLRPQYFFSKDTQLYTAMFSDIAVAESCVSCHNEHTDSPKDDWRLNDIMGATTWSYPHSKVSLDEALEVLEALRQGFRDAYTAYLEKAQTFSKRLEIGNKWPRDGYFLPSVETFMEEAYQRASADTLKSVLAALEPLNERRAASNQGGSSVATLSGVTRTKEQLSLAMRSSGLQTRSQHVDGQVQSRNVDDRPKIRRPAVTKVVRTAESTLSLRTRGSSWVEVVDAYGQRLLRELLEPNGRATITATPPFHLRLGDPSQVSLEYDGEPIDHSRYHAPDATAQFQIDRSALR